MNILNKISSTKASVLTALLLIGAAASSAFASTSANDASEIKNHITIENSSNNDSRYHVNGKTFSWSDLTDQQKAQLAPLKAKLKSLEGSLAYDEKALHAVVELMEKKAQEIEIEAIKLEQATVKITKDSVNFKDIAKWSRKLADKTKLNEVALKEKAKELQKLEAKLPRIDKDKIKEIKVYAKKFEEAIVEIAETMD